MRFILLASAASFIASCGSTNFLGKSSSKNSSGDAAGITADSSHADSGDAMNPNVVGPSSVEGGTVVLEPPTEKEKDAIGHCSKAWGVTPPTSFEKVRKIYANVNVGSRGVTLADNAQTTGASLTLLYAGVNVGGTPTWELTNPNGWYCIVVTVNVGAELTVRLADTAHLADSKVAVNVGSEVKGNVSSIGVNVGSNIKVERL